MTQYFETSNINSASTVGAQQVVICEWPLYENCGAQITGRASVRQNSTTAGSFMVNISAVRGTGVTTIRSVNVSSNIPALGWLGASLTVGVNNEFVQLIANGALLANLDWVGHMDIIGEFDE